MTALRLLVLLLPLLIAPSVIAQTRALGVVFQNAVGANADGLAHHAAGYLMAGVQATTSGGPPTFTLNFEASIDGSTFVATTCRPVGGGAMVTTATATGSWRCNIGGMRHFRVRVSGYGGAGTITVLGTLMGDGRVSEAEDVGPTIAMQYVHAGANAQLVLSDHHSGGILHMKRTTAGVVEPGSGAIMLYTRCGTTAGSLKIVVKAGQNNHEYLLIDDLGSGNVGC